MEVKRIGEVTEVKRIDIKEFRKFGFLQEANRQFFHPLGLALEVIIDEETGEETLGGVWDYRDDPEGMLFKSEEINLEKAANVRKLFQKKAQHRLDNFSFVIQTLPVEEWKL